MCRAKNRLVGKTGPGLLDYFGRFSERSRFARAFSAVSRRAVGSHIHSIKLEVNSDCMLACEMCYVEKSKRQIPLANIKKLLDRTAPYGIRLELLGGEPLLRGDVVEIVRHAKKVARSPFVSLYTNGMLASRELSGELARAGLDAAIVTLVSHREDVHDGFTGRAGSFRRTVAGMRNLQESGIDVYSFTAVHARNCGDYRDIYDYVKRELGHRALFYQYIPRGAGDPLAIDAQTWRDIKRWLLYEKNRPHMDYIRKFFMLTGNACSGGNFVFTVKADGSVQPCPFLSDVPLGSIYEDDIWDIFKNRFESPLLREFKRLPDECSACSYASVCGGGCRAGNRALVGSYNSKDRRCLGPFSKEIALEDMCDCVPCFF